MDIQLGVRVQERRPAFQRAIRHTQVGNIEVPTVKYTRTHEGYLARLNVHEGQGIRRITTPEQDGPVELVPDGALVGFDLSMPRRLCARLCCRYPPVKRDGGPGVPLSVETAGL